MAVSMNWGSFLGCPYNKDHNILGSILGPLISGGSHMSICWPHLGLLLGHMGHLGLLSATEVFLGPVRGVSTGLCTALSSLFLGFWGWRVYCRPFECQGVLVLSGPRAVARGAVPRIRRKASSVRPNTVLSDQALPGGRRGARSPAVTTRTITTTTRTLCQTNMEPDKGSFIDYCPL